MRRTKRRRDPSRSTSTTSITSNDGILSLTTSTQSSLNCDQAPFDKQHSRTVHGNGGASKSLTDRVRLVVGDLPFDLTIDDEGDEESRFSLGQKQAEELAVECASARAELHSLLPMLLAGSQKNGYHFGKKLGEVMVDHKNIIDEF